MEEDGKQYYCKKGPLAFIFRDPDKRNLIESMKKVHWRYQNMDTELNCIKSAVIRTNRATILVYQFINAHFLYLLRQNSIFPKIDRDYVMFIFRIVTSPSFSEYPEHINSPICQFFRNEFLPRLQLNSLVPREYLDPILDYAATGIITAIENNIKVHFVHRFYGYVNTSFILKHYAEHHLDPVAKPTPEIKSEISRETRPIKNYFYGSGPMPTNSIHAQWIRNECVRIPNRAKELNLAQDLARRPQEYLRTMFHMNRFLESNGKKLFHALPLRSDVVPKHIELDTSCLLQLFPYQDKQKMKSAVDTSKSKVWGNPNWDPREDQEDPRFAPTQGNMVFDVMHRLFKPKRGYRFDHSIETDGISVSLRFIKIDPSSQVESSGSSAKKGKKKFIGKGKNASASTEAIPNEVAPESRSEFSYPSDLSDFELERIKNSHRVYVDPGKHNLIYCMDDDEKIFRYTLRQRIHETDRIHNQKTFDWFKKQNGIEPAEAFLSRHNPKTCFYSRFMDYVRDKNYVNAFLFRFYEQEWIRKVNLRSHINTERSEAKLIDNLKKTYQTDDRPVVLIYGDGMRGSHQLKGIRSTPMVGLKRRLSQAFKVIHFDEFRTSCLDWRSAKRNWKLPNGIVNEIDDRPLERGELRRPTRQVINEVNGVLVSYQYDTSGRRTGNFIYQSRDRNAVLNFRKLIQFDLNRQPRPLEYRREFKLPNRRWRSDLDLQLSIQELF